MESNNNYKESISESQSNIKDNKTITLSTLKTLKTLKSKKLNHSPLLSLYLKIGENNFKKLEINTPDEIEEKINLFYQEYNIPSQAKKDIHNLIIKELNKKILECKYYFI